MQCSVLEYLEKTENSFPDKEAVVDAGGSLTFRSLTEMASQIACLIKKKSDARKSPILVYLPKSKEEVAAFVGILYTQNFYTPTDVNFPFPKVEGVIRQLSPEIIVTDSLHKEILLENGIREEMIVDIDERREGMRRSYIPDGGIDTDVIYTLFTSGSTGIPKGVSICHRSVIDYIDWAKDAFQICGEDRIGNQAPFYFDNSTLDIYLMMSTGATLYIIPEKYYSFPARLMQYVSEQRINTIFWVPSVLANVANHDLLSKVDCRCLNKILFAGEVMPNRHLNYWRRHIPDAVYANLYGPTEITVDCTFYIVEREFSDSEPLPIGKPCRNSDVLVLDEDGRLVTEPDVCGELCVRGSSLALGYWNSHEKTAEAFVQNPLNSHLPERIYRTGDLVYYNDYGELMFSGRKDFQIKHMGYRIELGEIEAAAGGVEEIKEASVCYDAEEKKIVMFYQSDSALEPRLIRRKLLETIPKYMIPSVFVKMDKFRMTDNGKVDRKAMMADYMKGVVEK